MTARRTAYLLVAVLACYAVLVVDRGWLLLRDGRPVTVALGLAALALPVVGAWFVWRELRFGRDSERLGRELAAEGGQGEEGQGEGGQGEGGQREQDLPRRPSGRVDRAAADAVFARRRAEVEAAPEDWRAWYRLARAYGDAGDSARGREAVRHAVALHDAARTGGAS